MNVTEFREKININSKLIIKNSEYKIRELIKFRYDDGSLYTKCYLENDFVFADDLNSNTFLLVKPVNQSLSFPYPKEFSFDGKQFKFLFEAHAVADEIYGEDIFFKKDEGEKFWDYQADDGSYLSLGISDVDQHKADFYGNIIKPEELKVHQP